MRTKKAPAQVSAPPSSAVEHESHSWDALLAASQTSREKFIALMDSLGLSDTDAYRFLKSQGRLPDGMSQDDFVNVYHQMRG
ncbi:MAG: hypothetical protein PHN75_09345 [Syntrophales bacterium]|nr:hypothetical protein [Syntrophales bacterium]